MSVRFNPPPGWQVPPGFRPEAGWAPDPAWPPAPPGWEYWIEETPPPAPTRSELREAGARVSTDGRGTGRTGGRPETAAERTTVLAPITVAPPSTPPQPAHGQAPDGQPPHGQAQYGQGQYGQGQYGQGQYGQGQYGQAPYGQGSYGNEPHTYPRQRSHPESRGTAAVTAAASAARAMTERVRRSPAAKPANMLLAAVAVAFLALGCILGVVVSVGRASDATQAVADAERAQRDAQTLQEEIAQEREELDAQRKELAEKEKDLRKRETDVVSKESELTSRKQELDEQQAQAQQNPGGGAGGAWFYWDCNAARSAGAAPIAKDQPAYRPQLDPNGNGMACEDGE